MIRELTARLRDAAELPSLRTKGASEFKALAATLERFQMLSLDEFTSALEKIKLPKKKMARALPLTPEEIAEKIRDSLGDEERFDQYLATLRAPSAYSADQLKEIYNLTLRRHRSFAKTATKKSVLDELASERRMMLANDNAFEVIRRLSGR